MVLIMKDMEIKGFSTALLCLALAFIIVTFFMVVSNNNKINKLQNKQKPVAKEKNLSLEKYKKMAEAYELRDNIAKKLYFDTGYREKVDKKSLKIIVKGKKFSVWSANYLANYLDYAGKIVCRVKVLVTYGPYKHANIEIFSKEYI